MNPSAQSMESAQGQNIVAQIDLKGKVMIFILKDAIGLTS